MYAAIAVGRPIGWWRWRRRRPPPRAWRPRRAACGWRRGNFAPRVRGADVRGWNEASAEPGNHGTIIEADADGPLREVQQAVSAGGPGAQGRQSPGRHRKYHKQCWLASGRAASSPTTTSRRRSGRARRRARAARRLLRRARAELQVRGVKAAHKTSRTEKNPNRDFYIGAGRNCGFFEWCPTPNAPAAAAARRRRARRPPSAPLRRGRGVVVVVVVVVRRRRRRQRAPAAAQRGADGRRRGIAAVRRARARRRRRRR